ncbi:MAG TPA: DUF5131 family protein [Anaerolineae bacterium]|nr:DUF5131 family protein [Anaerolineae bacterium]
MTKIEWTHRPGTVGESWNMIAGCAKVQPECQNCYALRDSWRIMHNPRHPARYDGVAEMGDGKLRWTGRVNVDWDALDQPRHWREPRTVFVASMADLFHKDVATEFIDAVFDTIEDTPQHTYIVLTKRSERMLNYWRERNGDNDDRSVGLFGWQWPRNCWAGVSAGLQRTVDYHLPILAQLSGPLIKFISAEPLLGLVDPFDVDGDAAVRMEELQPRELRYPADVLDWVICGEETGPGAREMDLYWAWDLAKKCKAAGVPFFLKCPMPIVAWPGITMREWPQ